MGSRQSRLQCLHACGTSVGAVAVVAMSMVPACRETVLPVLGTDRRSMFRTRSEVPCPMVTVSELLVPIAMGEAGAAVSTVTPAPPLMVVAPVESARCVPLCAGDKKKRGRQGKRRNKEEREQQREGTRKLE